MPPTIPQVLNGSTLLVSGGAGFFGSVLLFRLLSPPLEIKRVYTLVRGPNAANRLPPFLQGFVSEGRLIVIEGDCALSDFGVAPDQRAWMDEVDIVVHTSAVTKFHNPLSKAIDANSAMAYQMARFTAIHPNVKTHVQISSCFNVFNLPPGHHGFELLHYWKDGIEPFVNTYQASKFIGEGITNSFARACPGRAWSVVRLSTVAPALKYPHPHFGAESTSSPVVATLCAQPQPSSDFPAGSYLDALPVDIMADQTLALIAATHIMPRSPNCPSTDQDIPCFHVSSPGTPLYFADINRVENKIKKPFVTVKQSRAAYGVFTAKRVVFRSDRARAAMGLPPLKLIWPIPAAQAIKEVDLPAERIDTAGFDVDPERAISEAGGWQAILPAVAKAVDEALVLKAKRKKQSKL